MNKIIISGRLTKEPELRTLNNNNVVCQFSVAVTRNYKDSNGNKQTDFFNCVAWRSKGEFVANWCGKGRLVLITGELNNREYQRQDGTKATITEIVVETIELMDKKQEQHNTYQSQPVIRKVESTNGGFAKPSQIVCEDLENVNVTFDKEEQETITESYDPFE